MLLVQASTARPPLRNLVATQTQVLCVSATGCSRYLFETPQPGRPLFWRCRCSTCKCKQTCIELCQPRPFLSTNQIHQRTLPQGRRQPRIKVSYTECPLPKSNTPPSQPCHVTESSPRSAAAEQQQRMRLLLAATPLSYTPP